MIMTRALDRLVADRVMGLMVTDNTYSSPYPIDFGIGEGGFDGPLLKYSTDIAAAWEIVRALTMDSWWLTIDCCRDHTEVEIGHRDEHGVYTSTNNSTSLAICIAALKAVGVSQEEIDKALAVV